VWPAAGRGPGRKATPGKAAGICVVGMITEAIQPAPGRPPRRAEALLAFPPPSGAAVVALLAGLALLLRSERTHGFLAAAIHGADLVFHEAGHPLFGLFGWRFLTILGGTLMQLAPPVAAAVAFWRRRQPASLAVVVAWLGVNLVHVGEYAADAQARALPLLGADASGHDWWNMLRALGLLEQCHAIGGAIGGLGWALQVVAPGWAAALWLRGRLEA
jgi:hypothetical protein